MRASCARVATSMAALAGADHGAVHDDLRQCAFFVCGVFVNKKQTLLKYSNKPPSPRRSHAWWAQGAGRGARFACHSRVIGSGISCSSRAQYLPCKHFEAVCLMRIRCESLHARSSWRWWWVHCYNTNTNEWRTWGWWWIPCYNTNDEPEVRHPGAAFFSSLQKAERHRCVDELPLMW